MSISKKRIRQRINYVTKEETNFTESVKKETGIDVQIWAARSISKVFDKLKLPYDRTEKTQSPSFTKNFLSKITIIL